MTTKFINQPKQWTITDFTYVSINDTHIYADTCKAFEGVGAFFYKDGTLITFIKSKLQSIEPIDTNGTIEHYYAKTYDSRNSFYLMKKDEKQVHNEPQSKVFPAKGDVSTGLTFFFRDHPDKAEEFRDEIDKDYLWEIVENIEGRVLHIQKDDETMYIPASDAITLEEVIENANYLRNKEK